MRRGRDCHLMDRCSCLQGVRRRHLQRRFAEPPSTNEQKGAITKPVVDTDFLPERTLRRCVIVIRIQSLMSVFLIKHQYLRIRLCDDVAPMSHQRLHLDPFHASRSAIVLSDVFSHLGCMLSHHRFIDSFLTRLAQVSAVGIPNTCINAL